MARKSLNKKSLKRSFPKAQNGLGRFIPPSQSLGRVYNSSDPRADFLPTNSYQMGNPAFAIGNTARFIQGLASGKDRDGDGLMDGAFRDGQAKRRRNKRAKMANRTYRDQYGRILQGDSEELWKKSKDPSYEMRTPQEKQQDLLKYSRVTHDGKGNPMIFNADREFDKRDYTKKNRLKSKLPFSIGDKFPTAEEMYDSGLALDDPKTQQLLQSMYPSQTGVFQSPASDQFKGVTNITSPVTQTVTQPVTQPIVTNNNSVTKPIVKEKEEVIVPNNNTTNTPPPVEDADDNTVTSPVVPPPVVPTPDPLSPADEFFNPYATKKFSPISYKLSDGSTQTYKTADDLYKGIIDPNMSYVDAERLFESGYGRIDNGQFTQLTNYTTPGKGEYGAADNYLKSTDQVTNYASNSPATYSQYGPAKNVPKHGIETDLPGFANASKPVQDMLRMVHFNTGIDPRVFVADASDQFSGNRGDYSVRGTGDISTIYNEDMLKNVDPQKLLGSINDIYRSLVKNTGSLAEQNPSYAKRIQFLADRYNLNVPKNTYTPARQEGGSLPKAQGGKSTAKFTGLTTYPYDLPGLAAGRSIAEFTGNWDDVYSEAIKDRSLYNNIIMYNGEPKLLADASEVGRFMGTSDDPTSIPYIPNKSKEEIKKQFGKDGIEWYNNYINEKDPVVKAQMLKEQHEKERYNEAVYEAQNKVSPDLENEKIETNKFNEKVDKNIKQKDLDDKANLELERGRSTIPSPDFNIPQELTSDLYNNIEDFKKKTNSGDDKNIEPGLEYKSIPMRSERFNTVYNSDSTDNVDVGSGYIAYSPELDNLYNIPSFAVEENDGSRPDLNKDFLLNSDIARTQPTMSETQYNLMKENLNEKDFNKWYKDYEANANQASYDNALNYLKGVQGDKETFIKNKEATDAKFEQYENMGILDKINANARYAIKHPVQAIVAGYTDPLVNSIEGQDISAKDYIYDEIYGTNTVEESSPLRSSNQYGLGKNNIVDMFSPVEPIYQGVNSIGNIAQGEGDMNDVANIGFAAMEAFPLTKLGKKYMKYNKADFLNSLKRTPKLNLLNDASMLNPTMMNKINPNLTPISAPSPPSLNISGSIPGEVFPTLNPRVLSASFQNGGSLPKAQGGMGLISKLLIEGLDQGKKLPTKMNFSDFYKSKRLNPLKFADDYRNTILNLSKKTSDAPNIDIHDYFKVVGDLNTGSITDLAKTTTDVDALISSGLTMDRLKDLGYSSDDILSNAVDLIGKKVNPFTDPRFDRLLSRGPGGIKSPFTFSDEGNQYLFRHIPQENVGVSGFKKDSQFFKEGSLMNPYNNKTQSAIDKLPIEVQNKYFTKNPTSPQKLEMQGQNFLQNFGPTLKQIMDGANPEGFLDVTRKTATLPINLNKYGGIPKAQAGLSNLNTNEQNALMSGAPYVYGADGVKYTNANPHSWTWNVMSGADYGTPYNQSLLKNNYNMYSSANANAPGGPGGPGGAGNNTGIGGTNTGIDLQSAEIGPEAYDQDLFNMTAQNTMPSLVDNDLPVDLLDPNRPGESFNTTDDPGFDYTQTNKQLRNRFNNKFKNPFKRNQDNISNTGVDDDAFIKNDLNERTRDVSPFGPGSDLENAPDPTQNDLLKNIDWDNVTYTTSDPNLQVTRDKRSIGQLKNDFLNSGFAEKMGAIGNAAYAANSINDFISENITKPGVENMQQWNTIGDARVAANQVKKSETEGRLDLNTGLEQNNIFGDGPSGYNTVGGENYGYYSKKGGQLFETGVSGDDMIQDLDTETIAKLIAAGADIEIL